MPSKPPNLDGLLKAREELEKGKFQGMMKFRHDVLRKLCDERNISFTKREIKADLVQKLVRGSTLTVIGQCH